MSKAVASELSEQFAERRRRRMSFRTLWTQRINVAVRPLGLTYSRLVEGLKAAKIEIDRKVLADLAIGDGAALALLVEKAKAALDQKTKSENSPSSRGKT